MACSGMLILLLMKHADIILKVYSTALAMLLTALVAMGCVSREDQLRTYSWYCDNRMLPAHVLSSKFLITTATCNFRKHARLAIFTSPCAISSPLHGKVPKIVRELPVQHEVLSVALTTRAPSLPLPGFVSLASSTSRPASVAADRRSQGDMKRL